MSLFRFLEKFNIGGVIGIIDGTHVAIIAPPVADEENPPAVYYNRKGFYSINVQIVNKTGFNLKKN